LEIGEEDESEVEREIGFCGDWVCGVRMGWRWVFGRLQIGLVRGGGDAISFLRVLKFFVVSDKEVG
jgi:hypothetical protein